MSTEKLILFACGFILLLLSGTTFAQCDETILQTDTIGSVKEKLRCFSKENSELQNQNTALKALSVSIKIPRIATFGVKINNDKYTADICKSAAISIVTERGGVFLAQGLNWVDFDYKNSGVGIVCNIEGVAIISVADPDNGKATDIATYLGTLIFK